MGKQHALALKVDGTVWSWGSNDSGQLGDGTGTARTTPGAVPSPSGVVVVAAGFAHSLALRNDGTLWSWGANSSGQLGHGDTTPRSTPALIAALTDVVAVAAGDRHSVALTSDGRLWTWGLNDWGQLGDGTQTNRLTPQAIQVATPVVAVAAEGLQSVVLHTDGTIFSPLVAYVGEVIRETTNGVWQMRLNEDGHTWEPWIVDPKGQWYAPFRFFKELHEFGSKASLRGFVSATLRPLGRSRMM